MSSRSDPDRIPVLWVDADAAPREVKEIVQRAALRLRLSTRFVANQRLALPANNPYLEAIRVPGGPDEADRYIAEHGERGDIAVTADIPLAAILVEGGLHVLDPRGEAYTEENIGERLSVRDFMDGLRTAGVETGGPRGYGPRDRRAFADALDRLLTRVIPRRSP